MGAEMMEVVIGRVRLKTPVVIDRETTLAVAERVNARLKEIEATSGRVDSYDFALLAAMAFAADLEVALRDAEEERQRVKQERSDDDREIVLALQKLVDSLKDFLREE